MPNNANYTAIQVAWLSFMENIRALMIVQVDDRSLDQYLIFRDTVFKLVQSQQFLEELEKAVVLAQPAENLNKETIDALILELKAFSTSLEVARATDKNSAESKSWLGKWLGRGSTVAGSVKDLLPNLPGFVKNGITLFMELIDLFKGKD